MSSRRALFVSVCCSAFGLLAGCGVTVPGDFGIDIDPSIGAAGSGGTRVPIAGIGGLAAGRGGAAGGIAGGPWNGTSGTGAAGVWGGDAGTWAGAAGAGGVVGTYAGTWGGGYAGTWGGYAGTWGGAAGTWGGYAGTWAGAAGAGVAGWGGVAGTWGGWAGTGAVNGQQDRDGDGYLEIYDCNDYERYVHPGAMDACCDFLDNDCDGRDSPAGVACDCEDPNGQPWIDRDGDGWSERDGDCDDYNGSTFPGAPEFCFDGRDQDCNGLSDWDDWRCRTQIDNDGDGWDQSSDCDDFNSAIFPGSIEICGDNVDNNCDGLIDPYQQCRGQLSDWDQDGFPSEKDCNDQDASVYPGSPYERCCDGIDSNCDNDDGFAGKICTCTTPGDTDGDGYGVGITDPRYADCNDQDPNIHPNALEECADNKDNDCDGWVDAKDPDCAVVPID